MRTRIIYRPILLLAIFLLSSFSNINAGEYPRTLKAYLGTTPTLDGFISEGEYSDAEFLTGVSGWYSDMNNGTACTDSLDLSVKVWYKHDGTHLYFAFDVTDNIIYGFDTERWTPEVKPDANNLARGEGWPFWGDGIEIMMNPSYTWDDTKKSIGDGTIWQTICSTHKSTAGGLEYGGLIEGVPFTEYAWTNYKEWYDKEYMKASVRIKTEEEGSGYVIEWRISPNPCMQIDENTFVDLSKESKVGINLEFEDVDNKGDGLGSGNLEEFRHVDYMTKLEDFRKNIAKGFATLLMTPEKMNPDSLSSNISENYESSLTLPPSHSVVPGTANEISVQTGDCGNNMLVINQNSPTESAQASVSFLWMDQTVHASFDITPEQTSSDIQFDLMSEEESVVKISFEDDSIRYYQNGSSTGWKIYEADTKYRIQIVADMQNKKYSLDVNGDMLMDLDFQDSTGTVINSFSIRSLAGSTGNFRFDNLIIQDEAIESSDFYKFDDCWDLSYDYEESLDVPANHIVSAESSSDVSIDHSTTCDNNSLLITDSSSLASSQVEVPFESVSDMIHVQFTLDAKQDTGSVHFDLRDGEISVVKVGLNNNNQIWYGQNESFVDWISYEPYTRYSFQIIANNRTKKYDFIVNTDTIKDLGFYDGTGNLIDNMTMLSPITSLGDYRVDNLVLSNLVQSELVFPFDDCVEPASDPTSIEKINGRINIYPNPSSGLVIIELSAPHPNPVTITDINGREIYRITDLKGTRFEMNLTHIESGLYLLNFDNEMGRFSRRIQLIK